jgi:hypothetical protein
MRIIPYLITVITCFFIIGCGTAGKELIKKEKSEYNFYISIYDSDINNPENDRRCYYMIYINKLESGRTATGLESQKKQFETVLPVNRHLVKVEKWVLNESQGRYVKMNNIDQPKPDFIYINIEEDKVVKVDLKSSKSGTAFYSVITE